MISQEGMGSPKAVVIYFVSIANQSLAITAISVSSRNEKERCLTRQNGCVGDQFTTSSAGYCVVTKSASPQRS